MKFFCLIGLLVIMTSCGSVKTVEAGKIYEMDCHYLLSTDRACMNLVKEKCPKGGVVLSKEKVLTFWHGLRRIIRVKCNQ